jgi:glutamate-5-semialdehyde dehydrogenase
MNGACALPKNVLEHLRAGRRAALALRSAGAATRNRAIQEVARLLRERSGVLLAANRDDLAALPREATAAFRDRLTLNEPRIEQMIESLEAVAALPDPVGEEVESRRLANGLRARRVRAPLGVILMIFESRPNVATEAASLAIKSGNVIILRGGKESMRSTAVLYQCLREALAASGLPADCVWGLTDPDRELARALLSQRAYIDVVVPRGGDKLIEFVVENSTIPIIKNDRGLCHVYVHEDADVAMAVEIVANAKTQRPGVCNAMETLLVHRRIAPALLPELHRRMAPRGVEWFGDAETCALLKGRERVAPATEPSWDTEYLDYKMNCRVVGALEEAIAHIERHGSRHSEAIVTRSEPAARTFQAEVDAAAVYWNASTRFTDGFELGLGGELGVSTQKLHVRGPVGLRELTTARWIVDGEGQIRG